MFVRYKCFSVPANRTEKMGKLLSQKKLMYLRVYVFFFSALSVNIIKDGALLDVDLACCRHSVQKLHGKTGKSHGRKGKKGL